MPNASASVLLVWAALFNEPSLPENQPLPAPLRTLTAANASQLAQAVSTAQPGSHIVLADGDYGAVSIAGKDFPATARLVIRARNLHGARFTGLTIHSDGVIVSGVSVLGSRAPTTGLPDTDSAAIWVASAAIWVAGDDVRITRCKVNAQGAQYGIASGANNAGTLPTIEQKGWGSRRLVIDHCDVTRWTGRGIFVQYPTRDPIISKNYIHHNAACTVDCATVMVGENYFDRGSRVNAIYRFNYLEGQNIGDYSHFKGSGNTFAFNVIADGMEVQNRRGIDNIYVGNNMRTTVLRVADLDGVYIGNRALELQVLGGNSRHFNRLYGGRTEWPTLPGGSCVTISCKQPGTETATKPAASNARVAGNFGRMIVGMHTALRGLYGGFCKVDPTPVDGIMIYQHDRAPEMHDPKWGGKCNVAGFSWIRNVANRWQTPAPSAWWQGTWWGAFGMPTPAAFGKSAVGPLAP